MNKYTNLKICSLNCRSLSKPAKIPTSQSFSRFLRSETGADILCLQETHATTIPTQERLDMQLQSVESIWSEHCGVISRNPNIHIESLYVSQDNRIILCKVSHTDKHFPSFTLMNLYAPASHRERYQFYANLLTLDFFHPLLTDIHATNSSTNNIPSIVVGDFNYNFRHFPYSSVIQYLHDTPESLIIPQPQLPSTAPSTDTEETFHMPELDSNSPSFMPASTTNQWVWHWLMTQHYSESSHKLQTEPFIPTFRRGDTVTTIDYMFLHPTVASFLTSSDIEFIHTKWTDHALLSVEFRFDSPDHGRGIWRANPSLAKNTYFVEQLTSALDDFHHNLDQQTDAPSVQDSWDTIKALTKSLARRIGRTNGNWRQRQLKRLQRSRNRILRVYKNTGTLNERLPVIERQIGIIQQEIVDTLALRSGINWRNYGDSGAGLLKRIIRQKTQQRTIPTIIHPVTGSPCEAPQDKQAGVQQFYRNLYTPEPTNPQDSNFFTNQIPNHNKISDDKHEAICAPFTLSDIQEGAQRSPYKSSPGPDGIPYAILTILLNHPATGQLALDVYNDALLYNKFPPSWLQTCMVLLPKKGDLSSLQNWRPISLINADAKVFTRFINARLMLYMNKCISTNQMGFMKNRFIGEQGMIVQCIQEVASKTHSDSIALLLDQQKAYDRIHFEYLQQCMQAFNIPTVIINAVTSLFSSTMIQVNVNGFLTAPFQQSRGLRQGDPLSPLLFNIAFDPLLRSIDKSPHIQGFNFHMETSSDNSVASPTPSDPPAQPTATPQVNPPVTTDTSPTPDSVKVIAYADDTLVALSNQEDFHHLQVILTKYMNASNAKLNYDKTQVLSLSGAPHPTWQAFLQEQGITHWHDRNSAEPLIYLGYALYSSPTQRASYAQKIIGNLKKLCMLFGARSLTYRAKVTIMNSLIFSKLWHMIRLFSFSQQEFHQLQQIAASFINSNAKITRFSFELLTQPRPQGGLKLLDPKVQANALQWRWLMYLLHPTQPMPTNMPSIPIIQFTLNFILSSPRFPTYHCSLLFASCRPIIPRLYGPIVNFLRAVDTINNDIHHCSVDMATCLQLPLSALFMTSTPPSHPQHATFVHPATFLDQHPTARQLHGSDIFFINPTTLHFQYHQSTQHLPHPTSSRLIIRLLQSNQLLLHNFILFNFLPFVPRSNSTFTNHNNNIDHLQSLLLSKISSSFNYESFSYTIAPPTTKGFKSLPIFKPTTPNAPPPLSSSKWKQFWRLRIPLRARNTWYRILHRKITSKQKLHQLLPNLFTPNCTLCRPRRPGRHAQTPTETNQHFLFSCSKKILVWTTAIVHYVDPAFAHFSFLHFTDILKLKTNITRTTTVPFQQLSIYQVFACIIQAIWQAHYRSIFDNIPFVPLTVVHQIHKDLMKLDSEETLILQQ